MIGPFWCRGGGYVARSGLARHNGSLVIGVGAAVRFRPAVLYIPYRLYWVPFGQRIPHYCIPRDRSMLLADDMLASCWGGLEKLRHTMHGSPDWLQDLVNQGSIDTRLDTR